MNTPSPDASGAALDEPSAGAGTFLGVEEALEFARSGRIISAIKHLEAANPKISREKAKRIVYSFGYGSGSRWSDADKWPERNKRPVRCL